MLCLYKAWVILVATGPFRSCACRPMIVSNGCSESAGYMSKGLSQRQTVLLSLSWQQEQCVSVKLTQVPKCSANKKKRFISVLQHK